MGAGMVQFRFRGSTEVKVIFTEVEIIFTEVKSRSTEVEKLTFLKEKSPKITPPKKIFLLAEGGFLPPAALGSGPYLGRGRAGRKLEKIDFSDFFFDF